MVWFQCEDCGDNLKKPKLPTHFRSCSARRLSCIDCGVVFDQRTVQGHTTCISETEKYGPKGDGKAPTSTAAAGNNKPKQPIDDGTDISLGLTTRYPWKCSLCNVNATSQETLQLHAEGKKHRSKARTFVRKTAPAAEMGKSEVASKNEDAATPAANAPMEASIAAEPLTENGSNVGNSQTKGSEKKKKKKQKQEEEEEEEEQEAATEIDGMKKRKADVERQESVGVKDSAKKKKKKNGAEEGDGEQVATAMDIGKDGACDGVEDETPTKSKKKKEKKMKEEGDEVRSAQEMEAGTVDAPSDLNGSIRKRDGNDANVEGDDVAMVQADDGGMNGAGCLCEHEKNGNADEDQGNGGRKGKEKKRKGERGNTVQNLQKGRGKKAGQNEDMDGQLPVAANGVDAQVQGHSEILKTRKWKSILHGLFTDVPDSEMSFKKLQKSAVAEAMTMTSRKHKEEDLQAELLKQVAGLSEFVLEGKKIRLVA